MTQFIAFLSAKSLTVHIHFMKYVALLKKIATFFFVFKIARKTVDSAGVL